MAEKIECKHHQWIPLLGVNNGKAVSTSLFTCVKCGDLKIGSKTIKISRFRLDMGELPIHNAAGIRLMNPPTDDLAASGLIINATVDTNAQGVGAPLFMAADGHLDTADADTNATSPCVALALDSGTGANKRILVHGILKNVSSWNWTTGPGDASLIYVSTDVGTLTQTKPSAAENNVIQPVGWALNADCIYFAPSMIYLTYDAP